MWTEDCDSAFKSVKAILAREPVLLAPNFDAPFKLAVDACDIGVGAVLLQADAARLDRPVACYSKKLNKHQKSKAGPLGASVKEEAIRRVIKHTQPLQIGEPG